MTDDNAELIAELQRLFDGQPQVYDEPGVTFRQLKKSMKIGNTNLREKLQNLIEDGKVEAIKTTRPNVVDSPAYSVVYRPVRAQETGYNSADEL